MWTTHATYAFLIVGMVVATLGEMLIAPTVPALITATARQHAAFYLGVSGGIASVGRLIGPVLFGTLFDHAAFLRFSGWPLAHVLVPSWPSSCSNG
ncbi:hypothetical protein GCM10025858_20900 [Alicyclobacillus sacchari]|uniref:hypothetical protein n=1 Tax=Alicyclobacillus sacchari TaxID=392010 RepID=UPI0023E9BF76|nr:hypothetical protein [Alicyclobacillus sacchari]GMA57587.1 hypothetical protein GCM10025858_20900 [Alicyclobacillus sacchari]